MKTLVIGTGGREHALARALAADPDVTEVHAAPGNPGMAAVATLHPVDPLDGTLPRSRNVLFQSEGKHQYEPLNARISSAYLYQ